MYRTAVVGIILTFPLFGFAQDVSEKNIQGSNDAVPAILGGTASGLPTGCRKATSAEIFAGAKSGIICPNDTAAGITQQVGEAKQYLRSILCQGRPGNFGGAGPDLTVERLNDPFAVCAANFLKFAQQQGQNVCLNEGYRTIETQQKYAANYKNGTGGIACTLGAGCEHPKGIAIDVNTTGSYEWLWNNSCQFGVDFYLRSGDKPHFVPTTHSRARGKSSCTNMPVNCFDPSSAPPEDWGPEYQPNLQNINPYGNQPPQSQGGMIAQLLRPLQQLFQPQQQQPAQIPQQTTSPTISPFDQPTTPSITPPTPIATGTSIADILLNELREPTTTNATGTAVHIVVTGTDVGSTNTIGTTEDTGGTDTGITVATNNYPDVRIPTTFTSSDLATNPAPVSQPTQTQPSRFMQVLENLKQVLLKLLSYLKPFGGKTVTTPDLHNH